jgi:hypothetical protein
VPQCIDDVALDGALEVIEGLGGREVRRDDEMHDLVRVFDDRGRGHDAHLADHGK